MRGELTDCAHYLPRAKELAQKAVQLEPVAKNYFLLGMTCRANGDLEGAASALTQAAALEPHHAEFRRAREQIKQELMR